MDMVRNTKAEVVAMHEPEIGDTALRHFGFEKGETVYWLNKEEAS